MCRDSFDFVTEFAEFVPMRVFGMLLGIPEEDQQRVFEHVEQGMNTKPGEANHYDNGFPTGDFYAEWVDERAAKPQDDIITRLITTEFQDEEGVRRTLTRAESLMYLSIIAGAGNHTTNRLLSWTAKVLAEHPDTRREVTAGRSLIPNVIEETLRFEPSSTQIARWVPGGRRALRTSGETWKRGALLRRLGKPVTNGNSWSRTATTYIGSPTT